MDLAEFEKDLLAALKRPDEWVRDPVVSRLVHRGTGIRVYSTGHAYCPVKPEWPTDAICMVPRKVVESCRATVTARETLTKLSAHTTKCSQFLAAFDGFPG